MWISKVGVDSRMAKVPSNVYRVDHEMTSYCLLPTVAPSSKLPYGIKEILVCFNILAIIPLIVQSIAIGSTQLSRVQSNLFFFSHPLNLEPDEHMGCAQARMLALKESPVSVNVRTDF